MLSSIPPLGMTEVPGIGRTKALQLSAALELGRRWQMTAQPHDIFIRSSADVFNRFATRLSDLGTRSSGWCCGVPCGHGWNCQQGWIDGTVADPKLIFSKALAMRGGHHRGAQPSLRQRPSQLIRLRAHKTFNGRAKCWIARCSTT